MLSATISDFQAEMQAASDALAALLDVPGDGPFRFAMGLAWQDGAADADYFPVLGGGAKRRALIAVPDGIALLDDRGRELDRRPAPSGLAEREAAFIDSQVALLGTLFEAAHSGLARLSEPLRIAAGDALARAICRFEMLTTTRGVHALDQASAYACLHRSFGDLSDCLTAWDLLETQEVGAVLRLYRQTGCPWAISAAPVSAFGMAACA